LKNRNLPISTGTKDLFSSSESSLNLHGDLEIEWRLEELLDDDPVAENIFDFPHIASLNFLVAKAGGRAAVMPNV
jgi:hypothetical protein